MSEEMIRVSKDSLEIEKLVVTDATTVGLIALANPEDRVGAVINCLQLGARVQSFANDQLAATNVCDQIEASASSVKKLLSSVGKATQDGIDAKIASVFGSNGKPGVFSHHLNSELKEIEKKLAAQLDPQLATSLTGQLRAAITADNKRAMEELRSQHNLADPNSPLSVLKTQLDGQLKGIEKILNELVTQQAVKAAVSIEKVRGTAKGTDFEDVLHMVLGRISRPRKDKVERTSNEAGLVGSRKCGDFVIEINPQEARANGLRIVIEAKNDQKKQRELLRELDAAMDNRGATFAIGISTFAGVLPPGSVPIAFPEPNKAIVYVSDFDYEAGAFEDLYVELAIEVGRAVAIATREGQPCKIDIGAFTVQIDAALGALGRFAEIRKRMTSIVTTAKEADTLVDSIRTEVRTALQAIRDALTAELAREATPLGDGAIQRKSA